MTELSLIQNADPVEDFDPNGPQMSVQEVADKLNVSVSTVRRLIYAGKLKTKKHIGTYRITRAEFLRYNAEEANCG